MQKAIDSLNYEYPILTPRACVVAIDTTYFGPDFGVTIFRDVTNNVTLYWKFVRRENIKTHIDGINYLNASGIKIMGIVVDGFWSVFVRYSKVYDIQMCQKHMKDIVRRYITTKPKLKASIELKAIMSILARATKHDFDLKFDLWLKTWGEFLKERSYLEASTTWVYTHKSLRSAVDSLLKYREYIFTYQRNHWLPNTNNSIEGFNSGLKSFTKPHRGLRADRKAKLIHDYLAKDSVFVWSKKDSK